MTTVAIQSGSRTFEQRRRIADRVFRGALTFYAALTVFWLFLAVSGRSSMFFQSYEVNSDTLKRVGFGILFFYVIWGLIWYGIKTLFLKYLVGFSKDERRQVFSSRMHAPFEVSEFLSRHSERRIRIVDMIGRRGRFITLVSAAFFYLYLQVAQNPSPGFASTFLGDNLADAIITGWVSLAFFYSDGWLGAAFFGPQARIMDGVLGRANCLLIATLWSGFKFVMVPIGAQLAKVFSPAEFAVVFALIWGSYLVADTLAEVGGSLFGRQAIRVRGIGDVNRKSIGGTVSGFAGGLVFCLWIVLANNLGGAWIALAVTIAVSNTLLELYSPRGTDDFVMATANALICLAFGAWLI
jgi:hypothetical protein